MLVKFFNSFMSYSLLLIVIAIVAGAAISIGIALAKKKNAKNDAVEAKEDKDEK